jgi:hypothetical protein
MKIGNLFDEWGKLDISESCKYLRKISKVLTDKKEE